MAAHTPPEAMSRAPYCPPRTSTERRVVAIWESVLGVANIGVHDDFFSLGADSMAAVQIANRVSDEFQIDEIFDEFLADVTTAADLARRIDEAPAATAHEVESRNDDAQ